MDTARIVLVTHPPRGARAFARRLVADRLAACVNLIALNSVYRWDDAVEEGRETLLVIKTAAGRLDALERHVKSTHPYDTPEFVALETAHVEASYLRWVLRETRTPRRRRN